ncbi:MAG: ARMT1-like domain-containing protein [Desulfohalobiaceae bacterium]|nr:ARMT1-like domain-containing protein [Desulfohalobiaceae bacterium]
MRTYLDCLPCFLRQALDVTRLIGADEELSERILRDVLQTASKMDYSQPPPVMGKYIHRLVRDSAQAPDPYASLKQSFNSMALRVYPELADMVRQADNPLEAAVRLAIVGNLIDFGTASGVSEEQVQREVDQALDNPFQGDVASLERAVAQADSILYLFDNAGEIAFDRLLLDLLPLERVVGVVKPSPIINDATLEDARACGITDMIPVVDTGSDAPGAVLEDCGEEFLRHYRRADLILAKGQGNYEALSHMEKNAFFLLKAKCSVVAADLGCTGGTMVLTRSGGSDS